MGRLTPAAREQLFRVARILAIALVAQPAIATLVASTLLRYPLVGAVIGAVEVTYHELKRPRQVVKPGSAAVTPPSG